MPLAIITSSAPLVQSIAREAFALLARITIGQAFALAGLGKLRNLDQPTRSFTDLGIPFPYAHAIGVGTLELVGGILLILGIGVRTTALVLGGIMTVAILTAHRSQFFNALVINPDLGLTEIVPWMFGLLLLALIAHGGGSISLDPAARWAWTKAFSGHKKPASAPSKP